jgi:hypothetical protein
LIPQSVADQDHERLNGMYAFAIWDARERKLGQRLAPTQVAAQHDLGVAGRLEPLTGPTQLLTQLNEVIGLAAIGEHDVAGGRAKLHWLRAATMSITASLRVPRAA